MNLPEWLAYLERLHPKEIELGLERIKQVACPLELAYFHCPVITVAGTNGKGSCVALLEAILLAAGFNVGTYTSPHIYHYNERVRLNGEAVSDAVLCDAFAVIEQARHEAALTYFEFGTLAALKILQQAQLDFVILEVGLGGRLDAVNIVDADVAIVSTISLDHTDWLGDSRENIAAEKAGIFRQGRPAVCGDAKVPTTLRAHAKKIGARLYCQGEDFSYQDCENDWLWQNNAGKKLVLPKPKLALQNAATVMMAIELLSLKKPIPTAAIKQGLQQASLPGRLQVIPGEVTKIFDVAHNPESIAHLAQFLGQQQTVGKTFAVFSMLVDKDIATSLQIIKNHIDVWHIAELTVPRAASLSILIQVFTQAAISCQTHTDIIAAYQTACQQAVAGDTIVVFGSFCVLTVTNFPTFRG